MPKRIARRTDNTTEAQIQTALMNRLRAAGWLVVRQNSGAFRGPHGYFRAYIVKGLFLVTRDKRGRVRRDEASSGMPDVLAYRGAFDVRLQKPVNDARFFEVKKLGGRLSAEQKAFREYAEQHGLTIEIVEGWDAMLQVDVD